MLGEKIRQYLKDNGITQTFLARKANLKVSIVNDICVHGRKVGAIEYYQICKALGLPFEFFFEEE